jgi:predicted Fe-Mo cluster-binding NifX family protein
VALLERIEMSYRVALALDETGDMLAHFGRASRFAVYEFSSGNALLLDMRGAQAFCQRAEQQQKLESVADLLADCAAVVAAAIGPCARMELESANVRPLEFNGVVLEAVRVIAQYPDLA